MATSKIDTQLKVVKFSSFIVKQAGKLPNQFKKDGKPKIVAGEVNFLNKDFFDAFAMLTRTTIANKFKIDENSIHFIEVRDKDDIFMHMFMIICKKDEKNRVVRDVIKSIDNDASISMRKEG